MTKAPAAMPPLHRRSSDVVLFGTVLVLLALGLVMVYSSSSVFAYERLKDSAYFFKRQLTWMAIGLVAMAIAQHIHYQRLRRLAVPMLVLAGVLLAAVLIPGIGRVAGGARRWIVVGPLSFQPVEVAKLAVLLFTAAVATRRGLGVRDFRRGLLLPLLTSGVLAALVLRQPDMGSAVMLVLLAVAILFLAGAKIVHLAAIAAAGLPLAALAVVAADYRFQRILAFLDPWSDPQGRGFHVIQSLLAFGSGGVFGTGLGGSGQKFFFLPERHTDFIFAIVGEELGLFGTLGVIGLFGALAYRGFLISRHAPDRFGSLLAAGITASISGQALLNMGVATGVLPVTGLTLPFLSFGGTSLVVTLVQMGVLFNISQYARRPRAATARDDRDATRSKAREAS